MAFAQFPEFTTLTPKDKREYERLIKDYPPIADFSFPFLMGWWGLRNPVAVSLLEGNIIISYVTHDKSTAPELCFIGTNKVDECICIVLDYLREQGKDARIVHVPEFVMDNLSFPEMFDFKAERGYDEYIISLSRFYPLEGISKHRAKRVLSFADKLAGSQLTVGPLDLSVPENRQLLLDTMQKWPKKGINMLASSSNGALKNAILHADELGFKNVCLKIDGKLHCFMLFSALEDSEYISLEYIKLSYAMPHLLDFTACMFAEWTYEQGVRYVNMGMDFGKPLLRVAKVALQPVNFFRKYTIEPARVRELNQVS